MDQHQCRGCSGIPAASFWNWEADVGQSMAAALNTAKTSNGSQSGSLQRFCNTSVPQSSAHPTVDVLPRLLHHPLAYGQLPGTRKARGISLQKGITKKGSNYK